MRPTIDRSKQLSAKQLTAVTQVRLLGGIATSAEVATKMGSDVGVVERLLRGAARKQHLVWTGAHWALVS